MVKEIRIGHLTTAYHTSFILMGAGWVEERLGLEPEWRLFPTGPAMVQAFLRGELDLGYMGLPPAMIGIDRGLEARCVAGGHMEGTVLVASKNFHTLGELASAKDVLAQFGGCTIGAPSRGSIHDVILRHMLEEAGLEDVEVKNFEWADLILEALEDHVVEGGCGTPPLAVLASRLLDARILLPPNAMWPHNPSYGIVASLKMIGEDPQLLEGFLTLHEEACNLIRLNPEKAAKIAAETIGLVDEKFLLEVFRVSPKYCASLPEEYMRATMAFIPVMTRAGYISQPLGEEDLFYTRIIERSHRERPHYDDPGALI